jgi:hypothetical protein
MGRPPTKEYKRPGLKKFGAKKSSEDFDEDLEEIVSPDQEEEAEEEESSDDETEIIRYDSDDEEPEQKEAEEEEEEVKPKRRAPPAPAPRARQKAPPPRRKKEVEVEEEEEAEEEEEQERPKARSARPSRKLPSRRDEEQEEDAEEELGEGEEDLEDEAEKPSGPGWLTIGVLVAIAGFFAAFISLPVLFFQNNPVLGIAAVLAIGTAVFMYFRTDPEKRDSFFLSGPGLVTLAALLCLFLGGLSEFNKEKQRLADEAEAAALQAQKDRETADAAAKAKAEAEAQPVVQPSRPGTEGVTSGKWTITQDERGAYRVNGKKITGTWKLKDDQERMQFLSEEEKKEIQDALNKFDDLNQKKQ